jgi:hypothetical protein
LKGGEWVIADTNFENVFQAFITLFIVGATDGWLDVLVQAMDSGSEEEVLLSSIIVSKILGSS